MTRSHIYVRPLNYANEAEKAAFVEAVRTSERAFPKDVFTLSTTVVMVAERREEHGMEVIAYMPFHIPLVMGSLISAGGTDVEIASALHQFTQEAYSRVHSQGFSELLLFSSTEETLAFALRHGYTNFHRCLHLEVR